MSDEMTALEFLKQRSDLGLFGETLLEALIWDGRLPKNCKRDDFLKMAESMSADECTALIGRYGAQRGHDDSQTHR